VYVVSAVYSKLYKNNQYEKFWILTSRESGDYGETKNILLMLEPTKIYIYIYENGNLNYIEQEIYYKISEF
jgi:hypothetical protein